jgi:hypothetical protein
LSDLKYVEFPANIEAKETICNAKLLTRLVRPTVCFSLNWFSNVFKKKKFDFSLFSAFCMEINRFNEKTLSAFGFWN